MIQNGKEPAERSDWIVLENISGRWRDASEYFGDGIVAREFDIRQNGSSVSGTFSETYKDEPDFRSNVSGEYNGSTGVLTLHYQDRIRDGGGTSHAEAVTWLYKFTSNTEMHETNDSGKDYETFVRL